MRFIVRLIAIACLAGAVLVPTAASADRMWVGFHDDPMFRWDGTRLDALDRARANNATILRTIVDWSQVAPDASHPGQRPVRPRVPVRRHRRVRPERAAARHGGGDHHLGHARPGPTAARSRRRCRRTSRTSRTSRARSQPGTRAGTPATRTCASSRSGTSRTWRRSSSRSSTPAARSSAPRTTQSSQGRGSPGSGGELAAPRSGSARPRRTAATSTVPASPTPSRPRPS